MPDAPYRPDPAFARFAQGAPFYDEVEAAAFPQRVLRYRNQRWAGRVGLGGFSDAEWIEHFGRFRPLKDNIAAPLALRYHGHQFRAYNPDIGDGRGFLFGQLRDDRGRLLDLGTKGSGKTPYSRFGDGRLTLKGGVREILATEMLEALGVYTSKTFSLIETGEALERQDEPSPTRASVLVRLSHSHVRFGTFQRLAFEGDVEAIARLIDYCVAEFDPDLAGLPQAEKAAAFYGRVVARTARLAAQWMAAGFVHGVLNTDNMNVTGESFDYGPWRFAPAADPQFTAAYFDQTGLYAFGRQSEAAAWNLSRLGGTLMQVAEEKSLNDGLNLFPAAFEEGMADAFFRRLGLTRKDAADFDLVVELLRWMEASRAPYERVFFDWFGGPASETRAMKSPLAAAYGGDDFSSLRRRLLDETPDRPERLDHPYFADEAPCTMLIDEVEAIWAPIDESDDWSRFEAKLEDIGRMREAFGFDASAYRPV
ncbi:MAG: YdiU family protein [Pseudomonadota bacterium]|nr:YdiU family protein [Pseudomonadota bacterium]